MGEKNDIIKYKYSKFAPAPHNIGGSFLCPHELLQFPKAIKKRTKHKKANSTISYSPPLTVHITRDICSKLATEIFVHSSMNLVC